MEYPYKNQKKAKEFITVDCYIMFAERNPDGTHTVLDSGTVVAKDGNNIAVLHEDDYNGDQTCNYNLDNLILYRDKDEEDIE